MLLLHPERAGKNPNLMSQKRNSFRLYLLSLSFLLSASRPPLMHRITRNPYKSPNCQK
ncbi:hypothetical protein OIU79_003525 [Salix purpurea]|uniref:Uncharacterized protein n=1 Tax=Salix purpurea TaxID=77065 RepID=A0A9Q0UMC8_SALPP|nr:hypothetical protein OIU79_003525 [Salix purpurea]